MAQRLATHYVKTCLHLSENEMSKLLQWFSEKGIVPQVKIYENGSPQLILSDETGEETILSFERENGGYYFEGECLFRDVKIANLMRKAITVFRGTAEARRIYADRTITYHYAEGKVCKIVERKNGKETLIYEHYDIRAQLEQWFSNGRVELEIAGILQKVNDLLDERNRLPQTCQRERIDAELKQLTHRLFVLEA